MPPDIKTHEPNPPAAPPLQPDQNANSTLKNDSIKLTELYISLREEQNKSLELHQNAITYYFTLIAGVFGLSITALYYFKTDVGIIFLISIFPILNVFICYNAISACDRYYQIFLEAIEIGARIEPIIGLWEKRPSDGRTFFTGDEYILPERWKKDRTGYGKWVLPWKDLPDPWTEDEDARFQWPWKSRVTFTNGKQFKDHAMGRGANGVARITFYSLEIINIFIAVILILYAIQSL